MPPQAGTSFADAQQAHARGDLATADILYASALREAPDDARVLTQVGMLRMQQKRLDEALAALDRAIELDPAAAAPLAWRGEVLRQQDAAPAAIDAFHAALARQPTLAPALFNLGLAQRAIGDYAAATDAWRRFLEQRPKDARVRRELGDLAVLLDDLDGAAGWYADQLRLFPGDRLSSCGLASVLLKKREPARSIGVLEALLAVAPDDATALSLLAKAMLEQGRLDEAASAAQRAAALAPDDAYIVAQSGRVFERLGQLEDTIRCLDRAALLAPTDADIQNSLAVAYLNLADPVSAIRCFRRALELRPTFKEAHSNLLMALHHIPDMDPLLVVAEHIQWAATHANVPAVAVRDLRNSRIAGRRLRIGYCSPRFGGGPLERFFLPLLRAHDRRGFEVVCFAFSDVYDAATRKMIDAADAWEWCAALDDNALADLMRRREIDILVDLVGHCPGNRLGAFARRGAPIQMTWMDYVDTTGLPTMDYFVTDAKHTPAGGTQRFTESLVELSGTRFCYRPADDLPAVRSDKPATGDAVTFGCFNRLSKITSRTVELWSRVLRSVPQSRLLLKATAFASNETRADVTRRFAAHGVGADQLDLRPTSDEPRMFAEYNEVDIVLDPLPYSGCTTTCDALSMGVPVVTRQGSNFAGRHATSLLSAAGFASWVTDDDDAFVRLATDLARSVTRDDCSRARIRAQFAASPVCDVMQFAAKLERMYRDRWIAFCASDGLPP